MGSVGNATCAVDVVNHPSRVVGCFLHCDAGAIAYSKCSMTAESYGPDLNHGWVPVRVAVCGFSALLCGGMWNGVVGGQWSAHRDEDEKKDGDEVVDLCFVWRVARIETPCWSNPGR